MFIDHARVLPDTLVRHKTVAQGIGQVVATVALVVRETALDGGFNGFLTARRFLLFHFVELRGQFCVFLHFFFERCFRRVELRFLCSDKLLCRYGDGTVAFPENGIDGNRLDTRGNYRVFVFLKGISEGAPLIGKQCHGQTIAAKHGVALELVSDVIQVQNLH